MPGPAQGIKTTGWVTARRDHATVWFIDVWTGRETIQVAARKGEHSFPPPTLGAAVAIASKAADDGVHWIESLTVISAPDAADTFRTPLSRAELGREDIMDRRHLWVRNPTFAAIARFRDDLLWMTRSHFRDRGFTEVAPPILTPVTLYKPETALPIKVQDQDVYLTQCVAYYLEALSLGLGPVLAIGPSFRGEESRSKRHLIEYTHIKAEAPFCTLDQGVSLVESWIIAAIDLLETQLETLPQDLQPSRLPKRPPYRIVSHLEAADILRLSGHTMPPNDEIGTREEERLAALIGEPIWIAYPPAVTEPFPYALKPDDPNRVLVADLIADGGYGEILGLAEKHQTIADLEARLRDDGRFDDPAYAFIMETLKYGAPPRIAFGAGVERLIRWLLQLEHVKDAIPFPRVMRRRISP